MVQFGFLSGFGFRILTTAPLHLATLPHRRLFLPPIRALLVSVRHPQNRLLPEWFSQYLQPNRQLGFSRKAARHADATEAGKIGRDGKDVHQVHLQRIIGLFSDLERRRWRSWR